MQSFHLYKSFLFTDVDKVRYSLGLPNKALTAIVIKAYNLNFLYRILRETDSDKVRLRPVFTILRRQFDTMKFS